MAPILLNARLMARPRVSRSLLALVVCGGQLAVAALGCASEDGKDTPAQPRRSATNGGNAGTSGGGASEDPSEEAGAGGAAGNGGGIDIGGGAGSGSGTCAAVTAEAKPRPVSLFVMLDQSGSMIADEKPGVVNPDCADPKDNVPNTRWKDVTAAIRGFAKQAPTAGLSMGLGFFPQKNGSNCPADLNAKNPYAIPDVAISPLPGVATFLDKALNITPDVCNGTPMLWAMKGAREYALSFSAAHPDDLVAIVLATDGIPDGKCSGEVNNDDPHTVKVAPAAAEAKAAFTGSTPVRTFVIGVGESLAALDVIAAAGGTDAAFLVDTSKGNTTQAFVEALDAIRGTVFSCELAIPKPPNGSAIDPSKVNVTRSGSSDVPLGRVDGAGACAAAKDGWYYDDAAAPKKVILCPEVCGAVKADTGGAVDVAFGCETRVAAPK